MKRKPRTATMRRKTPARRRAKKGEALFFAETGDGRQQLPYDPQADKQVKLGREFMARYRSAFRALAK